MGQDGHRTVHEPEGFPVLSVSSQDPSCRGRRLGLSSCNLGDNTQDEWRLYCTRHLPANPSQVNELTAFILPKRVAFYFALAFGVAVKDSVQREPSDEFDDVPTFAVLLSTCLARCATLLQMEGEVTGKSNTRLRRLELQTLARCIMICFRS